MKIVRWLILTTVLSALWYVLSGKFDLLHMGTGVATAAVLAIGVIRGRHSSRFPFVRFAAFLPWLAWQIFMSNLRVARMVLQPGLPIAPRLIRRPAEVKGTLAVTVLGCSITLTPGTLTIEADENEVLIHALDEVSARDIEAGTMNRKVDHVFAGGGQ